MCRTHRYIMIYDISYMFVIYCNHVYIIVYNYLYGRIFIMYIWRPPQGLPLGGACIKYIVCIHLLVQIPPVTSHSSQMCSLEHPIIHHVAGCRRIGSYLSFLHVDMQSNILKKACRFPLHSKTFGLVLEETSSSCVPTICNRSDVLFLCFFLEQSVKKSSNYQ